MGIVRASDAGRKVLNAGVMIDGGARRVVSVGDGVADESFDILRGEDGCEVEFGPS